MYTKGTRVEVTPQLATYFGGDRFGTVVLATNWENEGTYVLRMDSGRTRFVHHESIKGEA
jgi:hypothetical protein